MGAPALCNRFCPTPTACTVAQLHLLEHALLGLEPSSAANLRSEGYVFTIKYFCCEASQQGDLEVSCGNEARTAAAVRHTLMR